MDDVIMPQSDKNMKPKPNTKYRWQEINVEGGEYPIAPMTFPAVNLPPPLFLLDVGHVKA